MSTGKVISDKKLAADAEKADKSGVIYLSSIPPFMKPVKLRHLLEQHAKIGRMYLVPESQSARAHRVSKGGNKKQKFVEGWVEFERKKDAKMVAAGLNATPVDPNPRSFYGSDLWNIKYLPGFKWTYLVEKITFEKQAKEKRLATEIAAAKKESAAYLEAMERAERAKSRVVEELDAAKAAAAGDDGSGQEDTPGAATRTRAWRQVARATDVTLGEGGQAVDDDLLASLFGAQAPAAGKKRNRSSK